MTRHPEHLSDEALTAAILIAKIRRCTDGRLGARSELAALEAERDRRIEVLTLEQLLDAS